MIYFILQKGVLYHGFQKQMINFYTLYSFKLFIMLLQRCISISGGCCCGQNVYINIFNQGAVANMVWFCITISLSFYFCICYLYVYRYCFDYNIDDKNLIYHISNNTSVESTFFIEAAPKFSFWAQIQNNDYIIRIKCNLSMVEKIYDGGSQGESVMA